MSWWVGVPYSNNPPLVAFQAPANYNQALAVAAKDQITISRNTPFATEGAAEAWIGQQEGGGGSGGSPGGTGGSGGSGSPGGSNAGWFVISTVKPDGGNPAGGLSVQYLTGANYQIALGWVPDGLAWGPYPTKAAAEAELANIRAGKVKNPAKVSTGNPNQAPNWQQEIASFFSMLGQASTWIRIAEVLLGLGLVIVGMAKLASGTAAGKAAAKIGETAAIL